MSYNGIMQRGVDIGKRIPGQINEMTIGQLSAIPMKMSVSPQPASSGGEKVVDLFLEVDRSDPQFMAINGQLGGMRLPIGRIHNTNLGNQNGLRHTFHEVKGSVRRSMGLSENDEVHFGDFTWRENLVPYTIEKMISEALDYNNIQLTGKFGPAKNIGTRSIIRETKWFSQPSMHIHDEVTLEEAINLKALPDAVKKQVAAAVKAYYKHKNKGKTKAAIMNALKGSVKEVGAATKYIMKMLTAGAGTAVGAAGGITAASFAIGKSAPWLLPLLADVNQGDEQILSEDTQEVVLECPECSGQFIVNEDSINEDEDGTFVVCPHCHEESGIDEGTAQVARQTTSAVIKAMAKKKPYEIRKMAASPTFMKAGVKKTFGAKSKIGASISGLKKDEDLDESSAYLTLGGSKPLKGHKRFPVGQGHIMSLRAGLKHGIIPTATVSSTKATKYLQLPRNVKGKSRITVAYAVGKHVGAQEAGKRIKVTGLAMALGTLLGIAGFKKMLGTQAYANIKARVAEFVNSKVKGHDIGTEEQVTHAINTVTELPRVRWKLKNIAHTLQSVEPAKRQRAIDKAAMEIGLIVLKEIGM